MSGCRSARAAAGRHSQVSGPTQAPIANVIAASWKAGMRPVATVSAASSDHIRIALRPIRVAEPEVMTTLWQSATIRALLPTSYWLRLTGVIYGYRGTPDEAQA